MSWNKPVIFGMLIAHLGCLRVLTSELNTFLVATIGSVPHYMRTLRELAVSHVASCMLHTLYTLHTLHRQYAVVDLLTRSH